MESSSNQESELGSPNSLHQSTASTESGLSGISAAGPDNYVFPYSSSPGVLYQERVKSFVDNKWPWMDPTVFKCSPHQLAMAGLMFSPGSKQSAKCIMCSIYFHGLEHSSDPWAIHAQKNRECPYIKLGQRNQPGDYKLIELMELFKTKHVNTFVNGYKSMQMELFNTLLKLAEGEADILSPEK